MSPMTSNTPMPNRIIGMTAKTMDTISEMIGMMRKLPTDSITTNTIPAKMSWKKPMMILPVY